MKIKKLLIIGMTALLSMTVIGSTAFAAYKSDSNTRAAAFIIVTDIGPQPFAVSHTYGYSETYTPGGSYVRYTNHHTYSYVQGWTGSAFGSVINDNCHRANYYNSSGNFIKYANLSRDTDMIWNPAWEQYESATGTDIATVNTSTSTAKATFQVICYDAMFASSPASLNLTCN